jgi:serine-aspartate repeat-containing protein C/D/E
LALITSDMMTSDLKKRQIKPGESKKVQFEFAAKASTVPGDYEITVNFAERCSVIFEPGAIPFVCDDVKPIDSLTMIWNGSKDIESIDVYRDKYDPNDPTKNLMYTIDGPIVMDDEVTADGYAAVDAKNDVDWVITFSVGTTGVSRFHRSCSDDDMNGPEDCGKAEGNSKDDNTGFINDWIFEGMAGNGLTLDCTP